MFTHFTSCSLSITIAASVGILASCAPAGLDQPAPRLQLGLTRNVAAQSVVKGAWRADFGLDPYAPIGPMAVLADDDGFAVLDQENRRLLRYDPHGVARGEVPIPSAATLDAVHRPDGTGYGLLAYERLPTPRWQVQEIDADGYERAHRWLDIDIPTGVFELDGALLVEDGHGELVDPATGQRFPGRPDGAGNFVSAQRVDEHELRITWQDTDGQGRCKVVLLPDRLLSGVVSLDPLPAEDGHLPTVAVSMLLYDEGPPPELEMLDPEIRVLVVDRLGHRIDELRVEVGQETTMHRHMAVTASGEVLQLRSDDQGITVQALPLNLDGRFQ